jgi:hypothetical protein
MIIKLFVDVELFVINLNKTPSHFFPISWRVKQYDPLDPHTFFLLVGEYMNQVVKVEMIKGIIKSVKLLLVVLNISS